MRHINPSLQLAVYGLIEAMRLGLLPASAGVVAFLRLRRALEGSYTLKDDRSEDAVLHAMAVAAVNMHHASDTRPEHTKKVERMKSKLAVFMETGAWPK